jgi:Ca2+-binding EF-hand superfamily protein
MPGAAGVIHANKKKKDRMSKEARQAEATKQKARDAEMLDFVKAYDKEGKGLTPESLKKVLEDASKRASSDVIPTDDEVKFVLTTVDKQKNGIVDPNEVEEALMLWGSYLLMRPQINEVFDKFDTDHSGKLDKEQLRSYMQSEFDHYLGEGEVSDEDVAWILTKADVVGDQQIGRIEWLFCNTVWTRELVDRNNKRASMAAPNPAAASMSKSKSCCIL